MTKTITVILVVLMTHAIHLQAQSPNALENLKNVMPPSPNSAAIAQYGNWPVSLYTGVPNISIPVTTLKGRTMSVPITLSYHAAGNHVGDIASWVGLGWSLNAGGVITRSIHGLNDEDGFFTGSSNYNDPNDLSSIKASGVDFDDQRIVNTAKNAVDSEMDVYNFSALGKSYRLLVFADGSVHTIPHSNLKFTSNPITGGGSGWSVLMEDGTQLLFGGSDGLGGEFEEVTDNPGFVVSDGKAITFTSSWQLRSMTSANGEVINFTYTRTRLEQDSYFSQSDYIKYKTSFTDLDGSGMSSCLVVENSAQTKPVVSVQNVNSLNISTISSDLESVEFISTTDRLDLKGGSRLTEIKVFSKTANQYVEDYVLTTAYSDAVQSSVLTLSTDDISFFNKRLRLTAFEKKDVKNTSALSQKWTFDYNPQNLPSRRSFAQDHWGYFNGAANNTLLPPVFFQLPNNSLYDPYRATTSFNPPHHNTGANRDGDGNNMQAEILTTIHYPTGGRTEFAYEPNGIPKSKETFTNKGISLDYQLADGIDDGLQSATFTLTASAAVQISLSSTITSGIDNTHGRVAVKILDANGNLLFSMNNGGDTSFSSSSWFNIGKAGTYTLQLSSSFSLQDVDGTSKSVNASASLTYPKSNGIQNFTQLTGGLRVKSILDYDDANVPVNPKYYQYSNALIINDVDPAKDYVTTQNSITKKGDNGETCLFLNTIRNSSTKFAAGSIQGGTTGYAQVTVLYGANGENGKSVSTFTSDPDEVSDLAPFDVHQFPYPPLVSRDVRRGLLLSQKDYNSKGVLLKQVDNTYDFSLIGTLIGFKAGYSELISDLLCEDPYGNCGITRAFYGTEAEQVKHLTSVQTSYDENGQNPLTVTTTNYYDNPANTQPIRIVSRDSKGNTTISNSRTALEKGDISNATPLTASASQAIDLMQNKNMVSQILQTESLLNSSLVKRETTNYNLWNGSLVLPQNVQTQNGAGAAFTSLTINNYDATGNVLQLTPISGVEKKYLWDYVSSHPVAEITNAGPFGFAYTSFESDGKGNWSITNVGSPVSSNNAFTGSNSFALTSNTLSLSNLASGSYQVSLWATIGSSVVVNGVAQAAGIVRNGWVLYKTVINGTSVTISGSGTIDEVRLTPTAATMATYTYGPFGVSSITDINNITTYYDYDGHGRLSAVRDCDRNIVKTYDYNYRIK